MKIVVKRSEIEEVYKNGVLIGYIERKEDYTRGLLVGSHYDIEVIEDTDVS